MYPSFERQQSSMDDVEQELHAFQEQSNLASAWEIISQQECSENLSNFASSFLLLSFAGLSTYFSTQSLLEAWDSYQEEGSAPVIGHFSEWAVQGLMCAHFAVSIGQDKLKAYRIEKIRQIFRNSYALLKAEDYGRLYTLQKTMLMIASKPHLLSCSSILPSVPSSLYSSEQSFELIRRKSSLKEVKIQDLEGTLYLDSILSKELDLMEDAYKEESSFFSDCILGWQDWSKNTAAWKRCVTKTSLIAGGLFIGAHSLSYFAGIYWSGQEAWENYQEGEFHTIGGHSCEWLAEWAIMGSYAFTSIQELRNRGLKTRIDRAYEKTIQVKKVEIRAIEDSNPEHAAEHISCIKKEIDSLKNFHRYTISFIPSGYFF